MFLVMCRVYNSEAIYKSDWLHLIPTGLPRLEQRSTKSHISGSHGLQFPASFRWKLCRRWGIYITLWPGRWFMPSAPPERPHELPQCVRFTMQNHIPFRGCGWGKKETLDNESENQDLQTNCVLASATFALLISFVSRSSSLLTPDWNIGSK